MGKSGLEKIVQKAQKLNQHVTQNIPQIRRNPQQLHDASLALATKKPLDERTKSKAQYMLSKKGYDAEKLQNQFGRIELQATFEPIESLHETDLEGYLQHEHETLLLTSIEEAKKETIEQYNSDLSSYMEDEWEETKRELVSYFSQKESVWNADRSQRIEAAELQRNMNPFAPGSHDFQSQTFTRKMLEYARRIFELNESRIQKKPFPLAYKFCQVAGIVGSGDHTQKDFANCWTLVQHLMCEDVNATGELRKDPPMENEYASKRTVTGAPTNEVLKFWLSGSRNFLEEQYFSYMQIYTQQKLKIAQLGAMPSMESAIEGFVKALLTGTQTGELCDKIDGKPIWALIYYAIRSGKLESASIFAKSLGDQNDFSKWLGHWKRDPNHTLPPDVAPQVVAEYRKLTRQSKDPYKLIVHNIIGQCDPHRSHDDIHRFATEDYMWFKLNMLSVGEVAPSAPSSSLAVPSSSVGASFGSFGPSSSSSQLTLSQFQELIVSYGPEHFVNPLLYFQILLLSLQFETAIKFLESTGLYPVETLHFALTLYYYGVLSLPENPLTAPLSGHEKGNIFWNVNRHLTQYVRHFSHNDVLTALNYIFLIQNDRIRKLCLRDLIVETEEFSALLGEYLQDGTKKPGYLDRFVPESEWREIVGMAAAVCESSGKYEDAILLYDVAFQQDKVVDIVTKQLSRVVTGYGPERQRLINLATSKFIKYDRTPPRNGLLDIRGDKVWDQALQSFHSLLELCHFFDAYHASKYHEAIEIMVSLGLMPFDRSQMEVCTTAFKNTTDAVRRNFAEILLAVMTCLYRMFIAIKEDGLNAEREAYLKSLKSKAKSIVTFSGMISFRMPSDTQSRLVRMEASMT